MSSLCLCQLLSTITCSIGNKPKKGNSRLLFLIAHPKKIEVKGRSISNKKSSWFIPLFFVAHKTRRHESAVFSKRLFLIEYTA